MQRKTIAIITARGGSKRIPRKNIREFCGKPILAYSIETAIKSHIFDEVMVSTDDEEIKDIALKYGAKVPFMRSAEMSDDNTMTYQVLLEVLNEYRKRDIEFKYMCCIYPTAPFITVDNLNKAMRTLENEGADSIIPMVQFSFPPQRSFVMSDEKITFKWPENELVRSQDLEPMYHDAGQFYFLNVEKFLKNHTLITDNTKPIILDDLEVQDIDNESDWRMAEFKYKYLHSII